jgi:hypothetical protein
VSDETAAPRLWPANVPAEAEATKMLLGELPPGEFQSVIESFRASLGPVEKGVLDLRSNAVLVTALAVKWRLTAAIAVAPVKLEEVDLAAVDALVQESSDANLGLSGGAATVTDFNLKQIYESTKRSLTYLAGKLKAAVPKEAPPPPPEPVAPPEPVVEKKPEPALAPEVAARSIAEQEQAAGRGKGLLLIFGVVAVVGLGVHGYRYSQESAAKKERAAKEAKLPTEFSAGSVTHITLRQPSPDKVAELETRAAAEGKRLLKITETEYQLVPATGGAPAPTPAPAPEDKAPDAPKPDAPSPDAPKPDAPKADAPKPDAPKPDEKAPEAPAPAPKEGEGTK